MLPPLGEMSGEKTLVVTADAGGSVAAHNGFVDYLSEHRRASSLANPTYGADVSCFRIG